MSALALLSTFWLEHKIIGKYLNCCCSGSRFLRWWCRWCSSCHNNSAACLRRALARCSVGWCQSHNCRQLGLSVGTVPDVAAAIIVAIVVTTRETAIAVLDWMRLSLWPLQLWSMLFGWRVNPIVVSVLDSVSVERTWGNIKCIDSIYLLHSQYRWPDSNYYLTECFVRFRCESKFFRSYHRSLLTQFIVKIEMLTDLFRTKYTRFVKYLNIFFSKLHHWIDSFSFVNCC